MEGKDENAKLVEISLAHDTEIECPPLAKIMQDIVTESIQLQTIKDGSVWMPHNSVSACPCPPLANIMHDIVTESVKLQTIKNGSVWLPHDTS